MPLIGITNDEDPSGHEAKKARAIVVLVAEVRRLRKLANQTYTVTMDEVADGTNPAASTTIQSG